MSRKEKKKISHILEMIYPSRCPLCGQLADAKDPDAQVCDICRSELTYVGSDYCMKCGKPLQKSEDEYCFDCMKRKHVFEQARSVFSYRGSVRKSLYRFKYANCRTYASFYSTEIMNVLGRWIREKKPDLIVPVPVHKKKLRRRGYNQASLIASGISECLGIEMNSRCLVRVKNTLPQRQLSASDRNKNLANAFEVRGEAVQGKRILLVDDIYTTGATADATASVLKKAGALEIWVVCVAVGG